MSLLGAIRSKSWLLLLVIGLALLAFVLDPDTLQRIKGNPDALAKVNGQEITREQYADALKNIGDLQTGLSKAQQAKQAWSGLVNKILLNQQAEKWDLNYNDKLFWSLLEKQTPFGQDSSVKDAQGRFDVQKFKANLAQVQAEAQKGNPQAQQFVNYWQMVEKSARESVVPGAYLKMYDATHFITKKQAMFYQQAANTKLNFSYVRIPYEIVHQKTKLDVSDAEIEQYIKQNKKKFENKEDARNLRLVYFPLVPSNEDKKAVKEALDLYLKGSIQKNDFSQTAEALAPFAQAQNDSLYVLSAGSEIPYTGEYLSVEQLPSSLRGLISGAPVGRVLGPLSLAPDVEALIKVKNKKVEGERFATQTAHILIATNSKRNETQAKILADSLAMVAKSNPESFTGLAQKYSDDPGSKGQGGLIGWVNSDDNRFVPEFTYFTKSHGKGAIGVTKTNFGYHVMYLIDRQIMPAGYQLAIIAKSQRPSKATSDALYKKASLFVQSISDAISFTKESKKHGVTPIIAEQVNRFDPHIDGISKEEDRQMIDWSFQEDVKVGDRKLFTFSDGSYAVAQLTSKLNKGLQSVQQARKIAEPILRNKKAVAWVDQQIKTSNLEAVAGKMGQNVQMATDLNFDNPIIESIGREPLVVATAFGIPKGKTSKAIAGYAGVFVVQKMHETSENTSDFLATKRKLENERKQQFTKELIDALNKDANIKDYRKQLF